MSTYDLHIHCLTLSLVWIVPLDMTLTCRLVDSVTTMGEYVPHIYGLTFVVYVDMPVGRGTRCRWLPRTQTMVLLLHILTMRPLSFMVAIRLFGYYTRVASSGLAA